MFKDCIVLCQSYRFQASCILRNSFSLFYHFYLFCSDKYYDTKVPSGDSVSLRLVCGQRLPRQLNLLQASQGEIPLKDIHEVSPPCDGNESTEKSNNKLFTHLHHKK
jgi:hypothetical protein